MAKQSKAQIPEVRDPKSQVAAAAQEAIEKVKQSSRSSEVEVVWNDHDTHVVKGNQYPSDIWLHGPAQIEFMAASYQKLVKVADYQGAPVKKVTKVRIGLVKGTKQILIRPTDDLDPDGIEVNKYGSDYWVNAISVLAPAKLTVPSGYRERYTVAPAPAGYPGGPALLINLGKRLERKVEGRKKAEEAADATTTKTTKTTKATKSRKQTSEPAAAAPTPTPTPTPAPETNAAENILNEIEFYTPKRAST